MCAWWRRDPVIAYGVPRVGGMVGLVSQGKTYWVDANAGSDAHAGRSHITPLATIQAAVNRAESGDVIMVADGTYDETVTIPVTKPNLVICGMSARGSAKIVPTTTAAMGMDIRPDECSIINMGIHGEATATAALRIYGSGTRVEGCKLEGCPAGIVIGPGTAAQVAAGTHGIAMECAIKDTEFRDLTNGIVFTSSDYRGAGTREGAVVETRLERCFFHNCTGTCIDENDVGGNGSVRDCWIWECLLGNTYDATEPTQFIDLDSTGCTGFIAGNWISDTVFASAKIAIAAGIIFAGNWTQAESGGGAASGTSGRPD